MAISDLVNNISGSVRGLGVSLGLIASETDPKYQDYPNQGISLIDPDVKKRWFDVPINRYVFGVVNAGDQTTVGGEDQKFIKSITSLLADNASSTGDGDQFGDFSLPITPQEITQTENFAVTVKPTQGGTVVQHSGNKYKDLVISGTTGVHPFKGITGADRITGAAIFQPDELKYRSGYEVFIHFRNWMKSYHQVKALGTDASRGLRMIFKNYKDWEFLIVEPIKFTMKRDASRPLLYNYSIQFKVLGNHSVEPAPLSFLEQIDNALEQAARALDVSRGIFKKFEEVIRATAGEINGVIENLRRATLAVKAARGVAITVSDVSSRIEANFLSQRDALSLMLGVSALMGKLSENFRSLEVAGVDLETTPPNPAEVARNTRRQAFGLTGDAKQQYQLALASLGNASSQLSISDYPDEAKREIQREQEEAALVSRIELETLRTQLVSFKNKFADAIGLNDVTVDTIFDLTSTTPDDLISEISDEQFEILYAFKESEKAMDSLLSSDELFDTNSAIYSRADAASGASNIGVGIFSFPDPNAGVKVGVVPVGATLEDIAFAELGSSNRWTELAEINGLKAPYIEDSPIASRKINHTVKSASFYNPVDLQGPVASSYYIVASLPTPAGAWFGKGGQLAQYLGSDKTSAQSWRFMAPDEGTLVRVQDRNELLIFENGVWDVVEADNIITSDVLRPGDFIKIPIAGSTSPGITVRGPRDNPLTKDLTDSEKGLGVDLKLNADGDLDLLPSGDLNVSKGSDNGAQAIVLKLLFEPGELKKHPSLGTQLRVGGKVPDAAVVRTQIMTSLLQDDRITDVRNINLRQNNSLLEVTFDVFFKSVQEPVPITIPI